MLRRPLIIGAVVAAALGLATHGGPVAADSGVKRVIVGLIDRQGEPAPGRLSSVHAYVVKVNWADLQSSPGADLPDNNVIDQAIARVRQPDYVAAGVVLKLRVFAGIFAPEWAKELGGAPIPYTDGDTGPAEESGTIGRFWTPAFGDAYQDLQNKLAARYDLVPEIREVTISRCTTIDDEEMVRQFGMGNNTANMLAAGYTTDADKQCIADSVAEHQVWQHTTSDLAVGLFPTIDKQGTGGDLSYTQSVMTACRATLGIRCGLQNNGMSVDKLGNKSMRAFYAAMHTQGPALVVQTATQLLVGDQAHVLNYAVTMGANSIELPAGYAGWTTKSLLPNIAAKLAANPLPPGSA